MFLLIDTSERDIVRLSLLDEKVQHDAVLEVSNRELLKCIDTFLVEYDLTKNDVTGIMVVVGEGGFTSTRLATTVANTFAYVQHIPVLAISKDQASDPQALIPALLEQHSGQYISATYSASPSITVAKKK